MIWRLALLTCLMTVAYGADVHIAPRDDFTIDSLQNQPAYIGILAIIISMTSLLAGWWLIRWVSALSTAGAVGALVLFMLLERTEPLWAWIAAACIAVLAGLIGWHLFIIAFTVQIAALGWALGFHIMQTTTPHLPVAAFAAGGLCALIGGYIGWRLAALAAIAQTILLGYIGIVAGMIILCQPINDGERILLAILVALITIPAGSLVQWRAHKRARLGND